MKKRTVYTRFREVVGRWPDADAVIEEGKLSFKELDELVEGIIARFPMAQPRSVGIVMSHGAFQIASMLAVLKSGASYVPAEPSLPVERIQYMMNEAGVDFVIDDNFCKGVKLLSDSSPDLSSPDGAAYVLYTSGTSGKPKGVVIENHSVVNYAEAFEEEFQVGPGDIMLQYSVCSFDIFVEEVFATLLNGGAVCVPPSDIHDGSIKKLMEFVADKGVTIVDGFPYLLAEMNRLAEIPSSVRLIISGGDIIRESYISRLKEKGIKIYNTYGPSETTVCCSYYRVDNAEALSDGTYPVGKPIKGVEIKILDEKLKEVAPGKPGEICILGEGVGRGYLGNPPEQKNYVELPDGRRMYRSGDLGYWLPDGNIAFLHRKDDQVMILGRRVEPEEVENVLNTCPCVKEGVVKAFKDEQGLHYLTAYFVPARKCGLEEVRKWLEERLVSFMIPEFFVKMKSIPLTDRGKVATSLLPVVMKEGGIPC